MSEEILTLAKLYEDLQTLLKSKGTNIYEYFIQGVSDAKNIWKEVKPLFERYLTCVDGVVPEIKSISNVGSKNKIEGYDVYNWLALYSSLRNVVTRYCDFVNGRLVENGKESFEFPSVSERSNTALNVSYCNHKLQGSITQDKELCLLLLPNGKIYYALKDDHASLAYWLNSQGVDIHNAIHFEVTRSSGAFLITSLYQFAFSKSSNEDRLVKITYDQAENINVLYDTITNMWAKVKPISYMIRASQGFGIGYNDVDKASRSEDMVVPVKNLRRLHICCSEFFDNSEFNDYVKDMHLNGHLHNPMM